eukprot:6720547-Prymnesium_polylepis.1
MKTGPAPERKGATMSRARLASRWRSQPAPSSTVGADPGGPAPARRRPMDPRVSLSCVFHAPRLKRCRFRRGCVLPRGWPFAEIGLVD